MKTYEELHELSKELKEKKEAEKKDYIRQQITKIEVKIANELFGGREKIEWYGKLYDECIQELLKSGFSVERRNLNYVNMSFVHIIYKSDNPVFLDKWQDDTNKINNKKSFLKKLFS